MRASIHTVLLLLTSLSLCFCGSGDETSASPNSPADQASEAFNSFCLNHPDTPHCLDIRQQANKLGFQDYFGDQEEFADQVFRGAAGFCGCKQSESPVIFQGQRLCEPQSQRKNLNAIRLIYNDMPSGSEVWATYGLAPEGEFSGVSGICHQSAEIRCTNDKDCRMELEMESSCILFSESEHGYCQSR